MKASAAYPETAYENNDRFYGRERPAAKIIVQRNGLKMTLEVPVGHPMEQKLQNLIGEELYK